MNTFLALFKKDVAALLNLRRLAREQSLFKICFVLLFGVALLAGLSLAFLDGFRFIGALGGVGVMLVHRLFALFFFGLGLMLVISNIITTYTTVLRSPEIPFLLACPAAPGVLLLHKWRETTWISAWAFFCVIIPFVWAFAYYERLPSLFMVWTIIFSLPFVFLHAGIGLLLALCIFRWLPRLAPWVWGLVLLAALAVWWGVDLFAGYKQGGDDMVFVMARLVPGLNLAAFPLWPSRWVAEGIMALARGQAWRGSMLFGVLLAQTLLLGLLIELAGRRLLVGTWLRLQEAVPRAPKMAVCPFLSPARRLGFLAPDLRAMIIKDWLVLARDPAQWIQGLFFFGLLALYFFNLRNLNYHLLSPVWRNLIVFLNMFSLAAVMCSFCSRFVYPQISLEGQAFWIVGMAPTTFGRVMRAKFLAALTGMLSLSVGLMAVAVALLDVTTLQRAAALLVAVAIAFALCGLATGLGAIFLDLRQRNPMAIISGFGGTLNLALSLLFIGAAILPFGMLFHLHTLGRIGGGLFRAGLAVAAGWLVALTLLAVWLPLALGHKRLMTREY